MRQHVLAAALLAVLVSLAPPAAAQPPAHPGVSEQANFCPGTYALCIKAPCAPIPTLPRIANYAVDHALCSCEVVEGWSMGPGQCEDRAPVFEKETGRTFMISTYSNRFNAEESTLACDDSDQVWAWCYGAPCVVDAADPKKAVCTCPLMTGPSRTLGGSCKQKACGLIWSAATPAGDLFANQHFYQTIVKEHPGYPVNPPAPKCEPASDAHESDPLGDAADGNAMQGNP